MGKRVGYESMALCLDPQHPLKKAEHAHTSAHCLWGYRDRERRFSGVAGYQFSFRVRERLCPKGIK